MLYGPLCYKMSFILPSFDIFSHQCISFKFSFKSPALHLLIFKYNILYVLHYVLLNIIRDTI